MGQQIHIGGFQSSMDLAERAGVAGAWRGESKPVGGHRIVFTPSGLTGTVEHGTTVLDAAPLLGEAIKRIHRNESVSGLFA